MGTIRWQLDTDETRAVQGFMRLVQKQTEAERKFGDLQRKGKGAGASIVRNMHKVAIQMLGVQKGIQAVTDAFRWMNEEAKKGARTVETLHEGMKRLVQVSRTPQELGHLRQVSRDIAKTGVTPTLAQNMVFSAKSQGLMGDIGLFSRSAQFMDPQAGIESVGKFKSAFGESETGTSRQLLNKFLRSAYKADVTVDEIAKASVIAAQPASRLGGSDEELLAFMSVLSPAFKSPETAAFRIARFSALAERGEGLKGKGLMGALEGIMSMDPEKRKGVLGESIQGAAAYQAMLVNIKDIRARIAEVNDAQNVGPDDPFASRYRIAMRDPDMRAVRHRQIAANRRELQKSSAGGRLQLARESAVDDVVRQSREQGESGRTQWMRARMAGWAEFLGADPNTIRTYAGGDFWSSFGEGSLDFKNQERESQVLDRLDRIANAVESQAGTKDRAPVEINKGVE